MFDLSTMSPTVVTFLVVGVMILAGAVYAVYLFLRIPPPTEHPIQRPRQTYTIYDALEPGDRVVVTGKPRGRIGAEPKEVRFLGWARDGRMRLRTAPGAGEFRRERADLVTTVGPGPGPGGW